MLAGLFDFGCVGNRDDLQQGRPQRQASRIAATALLHIRTGGGVENQLGDDLQKVPPGEEWSLAAGWVWPKRGRVESPREDLHQIIDKSPKRCSSGLPQQVGMRSNPYCSLPQDVSSVHFTAHQILPSAYLITADVFLTDAAEQRFRDCDRLRTCRK